MMDKDEHSRIREAYLKMAELARYRPCAPGDGCGGTYLSEEELADPDRLEEEASEYATRFIEEEDRVSFRIGVSNSRTNRALVFTIEAGRLLCGGDDDRALKLLRLAIHDIESGQRKQILSAHTDPKGL
jgi:hypothetical protein